MNILLKKEKTMNITKITQDKFKTQKWSGGQTDEIFIFPEGSSYKERSFNARISSATVELEKSIFTKLPDIHRFISPLDNNLKLISNDKIISELKPFEIFEFSGNIPITSIGKCRDFNLMTKGNCKGSMHIWNTEQDPTIRIKLLPDSIFWMFSYNSSGAVSIIGSGRNDKTNDAKITLESMQFVKMDDVGDYISLSTEIKTKIIYGVINPIIV